MRYKLYFPLLNDAFYFLKLLTVARIINLLKLYFSYYLSILIKKPLHSGMPFAVAIEPTTHCNLHCPECPTGKRILQRPGGTLQLEDFKEFVDTLPPEMMYLTLYFQGEPYLNPHFFEMAEYARSKKIYIATSTNGHFLEGDNVPKTLASGPDRLIISLDGADAEAYASYRKEGDFDKVVKGILALSAEKKAKQSKRPLMILQFLVLRTNQHQIWQIKAFGKHLGADKVEIKTAQFYDFKNGNPLMPEEKKYSRYLPAQDGTFRIKKTLRNRCFRVWSSAVITWDGSFLPCCYDKDARHAFGNLHQNAFSALWNGKQVQTFRKAVFANRRTIDICCNCTE